MKHVSVYRTRYRTHYDFAQRVNNVCAFCLKLYIYVLKIDQSGACLKFPKRLQ